MTATSFSARHNAKRAAERMITVGIAPSIDYGLRENDEGRFEIVWKTQNAIVGTEDIEDGTENDGDRPDIREPDEEFNDEPEDKLLGLYNPWPTGARVKIRMAPRSKTGTVVDRVSVSEWSVHLDFTQPGEVELFDAEEMSAEVASAAPRRITPEPDAAPKTPRAQKKASAAQAIATGKMPEKPVITSKTNAGYQKRFDKVEALASAGDWNGVRDYAINGVNSYAQMLRAYRERLLSAHAASISSRAA